VTETAESCNVCHGGNATYAVADVHVENADAMNNGNLVPTITGITDDGAGILTVAFSVADGNGAPVTGLAQGRCYIADMVPAGTVAGWDSVYPERWAYESSTGTWTDLGGGNYTYTFTTNYVTQAAPFDATATEFNTADTQRLVLRLGATGYNNAIAIQDFDLTGAAGAQTLVAPVAVKAPTDGCKNCHSDLMLGAAHANGYLDTRACVICHSPIGHYATNMVEDSAYLAAFIHGIHAAKSSADIPGFAEFEEGGGHSRFPDVNGVDIGYAAVTYPKMINDCEVCHTGNGNMTDDWKSNPTAEVCGSCHTEVLKPDDPNVGLPLDIVAGTNHRGGAQADNSVCANCHQAASIVTYHAVTTLKNVEVETSYTPVYTTTIDITPPANGNYYVAGETPTLTLSATNAGGVMTLDAATNSVRYYVYGPRAKAMPLYDTLPAATLGATSATVDLPAIPAGVTAGTYMIMAYITDPSSRVPNPSSSHAYNIDGWQLIHIQIGTATEELRIAGNPDNSDACANCHDLNDWTTTAHRAYFGVDGCLGCHNESGGHANPIANRVHAVHGATEMGEINGTDWSEVTFPQSDVAEGEPTTSYCKGCHNTGNDSYLGTDRDTQPSQWAEACLGCHGDTSGIKDHMIQNGGPLTAE